MTSETKFDSIFDYSSAFKYHSFSPILMSFNQNRYKSVFSYQFPVKSFDENIENTKEEDRIASILRKAITLQIYIFVILLFPLSFWVCIKKVHALERIVLMRLGKLQPIRGPGLTLVLPFIDSWSRVDLRSQCLTLSTPQVLTADGGIVEVEAEVEYQVSDIVSYVTRLSQQEKSLCGLALCCLTNLISERDQEDLERSRETISQAVRHELNETSLKWGLEISNMTILSVKVLKAAEPRSALGTIMTALKATIGQSSDQATAAVFPFMPPGGEVSREEVVMAKNPEEEDGLLEVLKRTLLNSSSDVSGCFQFDISGEDPKTVFCSFEEGKAPSVLENPRCPPPSDVCIRVSREDAEDLVSKGASPLQAYLCGRLEVSGDRSLLQPLAQVLKQPSA